MNDLKFVTENLCHKLVFCWNLFLSFFKNSDSKDVYFTTYEKNLHQEIVNKARITALCALLEILRAIPAKLTLLHDP